MTKRPFSKLSYALFLTLGLSLTQPTSAQYQLPDLGSSSLVAYDDAKERELGDAFKLSLHTKFNLFNDPETVNYIRTIGHRIASEIGEKRNFEFYVIDNPTINAFAGPNGIIGIHTGLIEKVKTEDELASVIAHEIAHVTQNHLSRRYEYNSNEGSVASIATMLAAVLIGMYDPNAGMGIMLGGTGLNIEKQLKNSRQHEFEADSMGIQYLAQSGYQPKAMADFFGKLMQESQYNQFELPEILRTHPMSESRLTQSLHRATQLEHSYIKKRDSEALQLIQARINTERFAVIDNCYHKALQPHSQDNPNLSSLSCLLEHSSGQTVLHQTLLLERLTQALNHKKITSKEPLIQKALDAAKLSSSLYPQNAAIALRLAQLLISLERHQEAYKILEKAKIHNFYQKDLSSAQAQIASKQNNLALAYLHETEVQISIGNHKRAQYFYKQSYLTALSTNNEEILNRLLQLNTKYADLNLDKDTKSEKPAAS